MTKKPTVFKGIDADAKTLGVERTHLWRVLTGNRESISLLKRYNELRAARGDEPWSPPDTRLVKSFPGHPNSQINESIKVLNRLCKEHPTYFRLQPKDISTRLTFAQVAVLFGLELLYIKMSMPHGVWLSFVKKNLPGISPRHASRHLQVAEAIVERLPRKLQASALLPKNRAAVCAEISKISTASIWRELCADLGISSKGGRA
jgi:hypothetical protein